MPGLFPHLPRHGHHNGRKDWEGGVGSNWKGMILQGRESADLFDLMDVFNISLQVAGASESLPKDSHIDQTAFLPVDNGKIDRDRVFLFNGSTLRAFRIHEYKMHFTDSLETRMKAGIDQSTMNRTGLAPWLLHLHTGPKEETTDGLTNTRTSVVAAAERSTLASFHKSPTGRSCWVTDCATPTPLKCSLGPPLSPFDASSCPGHCPESYLPFGDHAAARVFPYFFRNLSTNP